MVPPSEAMGGGVAGDDAAGNAGGGADTLAPGAPGAPGAPAGGADGLLIGSIRPSTTPPTTIDDSAIRMLPG